MAFAPGSPPKRPRIFERNDAFFVIFAIPSFSCLLFVTIEKMYWLQATGFGVIGYGLAYFLVHEVIIHQRIKWFTRSKKTLHKIHPVGT